MSRIKPAVSLYSLQTEYLTQKMSLADIMKFVKEKGAEGVEILPDQNLRNAPHPSEKTIEKWKGLLKETELEPVCADVFLNTNLYKNRTLTKKESISLLVEEIKQAHALGFRLIRLVSMVPYWVIEPLLPYCEKYDVAIAIEIHAGMAFDVPATHAFIEEMKRVNSPYVGIVIDTGIFCRRLPRVVRNYEISVGTGKGIFDYVDKLFEKGVDLHQDNKKHGGYAPELRKQMNGIHDEMSVPLLDGYENLQYSVMDDLIPYIKHFHFKMFEMTQEGPEYSIDYKEILQYLHDHHYHGYVACEYEGNRFTMEGQAIQEKEQVEKFLEYINKCLREIQG